MFEAERLAIQQRLVSRTGQKITQALHWERVRLARIERRQARLNSKKAHYPTFFARASRSRRASRPRSQ
jgi:hypothetical protein